MNSNNRKRKVKWKKYQNKRIPRVFPWNATYGQTLTSKKDSNIVIITNENINLSEKLDEFLKMRKERKQYERKFINRSDDRNNA